MSEWKRVNRRMKCPVCRRDHWCGVSADGTAAICMRVASPKPTAQGGWLHRLGEDAIPAAVIRSLPKEPRPPDRDWEEFHTRLLDGPRRRLPQLAKLLGVPEGTLAAMSVVHIDAIDAWAFPMRAPDGAIIGEHLRFLNGAKKCIRGSKLGLFMTHVAAASGPMGAGPIMCPEGASDTAYLESRGFDAIGRPSNISDPRPVRDWIERQDRALDVYIIADRDAPASSAERNTAQGCTKLVQCLRGSPAVRRVYVIRPPGRKDVRQWHPTASTLRGVLRSAIPVE